MSRKLGIAPYIHESASVVDCTLGRYTEVSERCRLNEVEMGDYSYIMQDGSIWCATIGKFANIAAAVRINAPNHPTWRATLHHFTYRAADYFEGAENDTDFFAWRRENRVTIGHDVWIGHGAIVLPGRSIGTGAVVGAGAVVTKDIPPYMIAVGNPARVLRPRFPAAVAERMMRLAWWDWPHERLGQALADFRALGAEEFLGKYEGAATPKLQAAG